MNLQNNKLKNFTPLPNEIFSLHLSTGELATYAVLMRLEDPRTYKCWPSYETIGKEQELRQTLCGLAGRNKCPGRWESGKAEHRASSAMASFAFVVRFSAPGRNRSPNAACGLSPHPYSWRSNV